MKQFFGCQECAKNFLKESADVEKFVKTPSESVLWLWGTHNRVNRRLHNDASEDPEHLKIQFPPPSICRLCYKSLIIAGGRPSWNGEKVLEFLVSFYDGDNIKPIAGSSSSGGVSGEKKKSEKDWWQERLNAQDKNQLELIQHKKSGVNPAALLLNGGGDIVKREMGKGGAMYERLSKVKEPASSWNVTGLDLSMCMMFYIVSTLIIFFLYYHFIMRRSNSPCKSIKHKQKSMH